MIADVTLQLREDDTGGFDYFSSMSDLLVDCLADVVKAGIKMLEEKRVELLSQWSRSFIQTDRTRTSKHSQRTSSSIRTAADAAALQVKMKSLKREQELSTKCDVTKIKSFEIMGFTEIFWKYIMKNAYLPKINILLQFGDEILALSCSSDCIQILVILSWL